MIRRVPTLTLLLLLLLLLLLQKSFRHAEQLLLRRLTRKPRVSSKLLLDWVVSARIWRSS